MKGSWTLAIGLLGAAALAGVLWTRHTRPDNSTDAIASGRYARAVDLLAQQADSPKAALALGNLNYLGLGVQTDMAEATRLYTRAALAGNTAAQYNLGLIYHQGLMGETDLVEATAWFLLANDRGNAHADTFLRIISGSLNPNTVQQARQRRDALERNIDPLLP